MTHEIWKPVPGFTDLYLVSDQGNVMSLHKDKPYLLKPRSFEGGFAVTLVRPGEKPRGFLVQRLVLIAFKPLPQGHSLRRFRVKFRDGNSHNCRLDNVEWASYYGEGTARHKLTLAQVEQIRCLWITDRHITQAAIARRFKVSDSAISSILRGDSWLTFDLKGAN